MQKKLSVPGNITLRKEWFPGFGTPEAIKCIFIIGPAVAGAMAYCAISTSEMDTIWALLAVMVSMSVAYGLFAKIDGQSIYDFFKRSANFKKEQQHFLYKRKKGDLFFEAEDSHEQNCKSAVASMVFSHGETGNHSKVYRKRGSQAV